MSVSVCLSVFVSCVCIEKVISSRSLVLGFRQKIGWDRVTGCVRGQELVPESRVIRIFRTKPDRKHNERLEEVGSDRIGSSGITFTTSIPLAIESI